MDLIRALQHLPPLAVDCVRLAVWLLLLTMLFVPAERVWTLHRQPILRQGIAVDLFYYFLNSLLPAAILILPLSLIAVTAHRTIPWSIQTGVAALPAWAHFAAVLTIGEIGFYWGHRWSHEIPLLWRFHAVHHSAEHIDWLVNTRAHPLDMIFTRLCGFVPIYALGLAQPTGNAADLAPLMIILIGTVWGFFIHANINWRFGWVEQVLATPGFHHWHHTRNDHRDRNYAAMLPILDRIFGTLYLPSKTWPERYGTDTSVHPDLAGQLIGGFRGSRLAALRPGGSGPPA